MKYEAPKLRTLMSAINAIQGTDPMNKASHTIDSHDELDVATPAYADWEE
jgi:hypothetical protein